MPYLVDSIRLIVINDTELAGFQIKHLDLLDVKHVPDGQTDLHAVTFVAAPEYDPLETTDPFLGTMWGVCSEVVGTMVRFESEVQALFVLGGERSGDTVSEVNLAVGKVLIGRALIVRKDVALQLEHISAVPGISLARFRQIAGFGGCVLVDSK